VSALILLFMLGAVVAVVAGSLKRGAARTVLICSYVAFAGLVLMGGVLAAAGGGQ
jgi:hypothetical protein